MKTDVCSPRVAGGALVRRSLLRRRFAELGLLDSGGDVIVERCWPHRRGGRFAWTLLDRRGARGLFGIVGELGEAGTADDPGRDATRASPAADGQAGYCRALGCRLHDIENDTDLPHLAAALDSARVSEPIRKALAGENLETGPLQADLLGYKPGRRAVIRFSSAGTPRRRTVGDGRTDVLFAKTFHDDRAARLAALHAAVDDELRDATGGRIRAARPAGLVPAWKMVLFAAAPGATIADGSGLSGERLGSAVAAAAALHGTNPGGLAVFSVGEELAVVRRWHAFLKRTRPHLADRVTPLMDSLHEAAGRVEPRSAATIHRDFYEKQLVWAGPRTTLLDLDTLARGDAAQDIGNLLAHIALYELERGRAVAIRDLAPALLTEYARHRGRLSERAVWFFAAGALVRGGALHSLRTRTRGQAGALWRLAGVALSRVAADSRAGTGLS